MYPRLLLVPHSFKTYSQHAIDACVKNIPENIYTSIFVVSTWHNIEHEHSFDWMSEALQNTHLKNLPIDVMYAKTNESSEKLINILTNQPDCLIIFNSDLTHYGPNYEAIHYGPAYIVRKKLKKVWEIPFLNNLANGMYQDETMPYKPCGVHVLHLLAHIVHCFNYKGKVVSYYDSMQIDQIKKDNFVSYVGMSFTVKKWHPNFVNDFCLRFPKLTNLKNAVFLSFVQSPNVTFACVGIINNKLISEKLMTLQISTMQDYESERLRKHDVDETFYATVTVLNPFISIPLDEIQNIKSQKDGKWIGIQATFKINSAIFIPDVWRQRPSWTIKDVIQALAIKANENSTFLSKIEIFTEYGTFT